MQENYFRYPKQPPKKKFMKTGVGKQT